MSIEIQDLIDESEWLRKRNRESETATHPCDYWFPTDCMCKGACSCHWEENIAIPKLPPPAIKRKANDSSR